MSGHKGRWQQDYSYHHTIGKGTDMATLYVFLGCPGSGKGTLSQAIKSEGYEHISTGDILRAELEPPKGPTPFGTKYKDAILGHVLGGIPFDEIQKLIDTHLANALANHRRIILDGYPKTVEQCKLLEQFIETNNLKTRMAVILLEVAAEKVIERISQRQVCLKCNRVYNTSFAPLKSKNQCDTCSSSLSVRADADEENTKKRVLEFPEKMSSIIQYYKEQASLHVIDANVPLEKCIEKFLEIHRSFAKV